MRCVRKTNFQYHYFTKTQLIYYFVLFIYRNWQQIGYFITYTNIKPPHDLFGRSILLFIKIIYRLIFVPLTYIGLFIIWPTYQHCSDFPLCLFCLREQLLYLLKVDSVHNILLGFRHFPAMFTYLSQFICYTFYVRRKQNVYSGNTFYTPTYFSIYPLSSDFIIFPLLQYMSGIPY